MESNDGFIQIGFTALRDHLNGGFLPSVPLYVKADAQTKEAEESLIRDVGKLLAIRMKQYMDDCREAGVAV